mmetsp:Transcript_45304/g.97763  ORF Transcript_45304/g.97763 Transcript_45304/m.97763 type:complete len:345 (+) Transcript_45304:678-1712(+)
MSSLGGHSLAGIDAADHVDAATEVNMSGLEADCDPAGDDVESSSAGFESAADDVAEEAAVRNLLAGWEAHDVGNNLATLDHAVCSLAGLVSAVVEAGLSTAMAAVAPEGGQGNVEYGGFEVVAAAAVAEAGQHKREHTGFGAGIAVAVAVPEGDQQKEEDAGFEAGAAVVVVVGGQGNKEHAGFEAVAAVSAVAAEAQHKAEHAGFESGTAVAAAEGGQHKEEHAGFEDDTAVPAADQDSVVHAGFEAAATAAGRGRGRRSSAHAGFETDTGEAGQSSLALGGYENLASRKSAKQASRRGSALFAVVDRDPGLVAGLLLVGKAGHAGIQSAAQKSQGPAWDLHQ